MAVEQGRQDIADARNRLFALCAVHHGRLGAASSARVLPPDVLQLIGAYAAPGAAAKASQALRLTHRSSASVKRKDFQRAYDDGLEAISLAPDFAKAHYLAGAAALGLRRSAEATRLLRRALDLDDDSARHVDPRLLSSIARSLDWYEPAGQPPDAAREGAPAPCSHY